MNMEALPPNLQDRPGKGFCRTSCDYVPELNARFAVPAAQKGSVFVRSERSDLDRISNVQHERTVNQDNTIWLESRVLQVEKTNWRNTLAGLTFIVHDQLDWCLSSVTEAHIVAQHASDQVPPPAPVTLLPATRSVAFTRSL